MAVSPLTNRSHRLAEASYIEATALMTTVDDFFGERNYLRALESLDGAIEELMTMREHLERLTESKTRK